jgi:hypothetical protein
LAPLPTGDIIMLGGGDASPATDASYVWDGIQWNAVSGANPSTGAGLAAWSDGAVLVDETGTAEHYAGTQWSPSTTTGTPPATSTMQRMFPHFAFDATSGTAYLFGGSDGTVAFNDLWQFSLNAGGTSSWTKLFPNDLPETTEGGTFVFDPLHNQLVLFGGRTDGTASVGTDETYVYSPATSDWTRLPLVLRPPKRLFGAAAWDPKRRRVVLHGGAHVEAIRSDTWEWDGTQWTELHEAAPLPLYWQGMAFSGKTGRMTMFGGFASLGVSNTTWELRVYGNACASAVDCYAATACVDHLCCTSLSCPMGQHCNSAANPGVCSP